MTDLEISKALALAIGWKEADVYSWGCMVRQTIGAGWHVFDYRDWNVIGPIAERYDCFPYKTSAHQWVTTLAIRHATEPWPFYNADTPQKVIALAVIGANK